jgi:hypothetical protein
MLLKTNTIQDLRHYTKQEPKPAFINSALLPLYEQTDLSLRYVYDCCLTLKPLKGIDINEQQIRFWYIEFLNMKWKKKDFDKQFEAIKRATLYGRIDFEAWVKTKMMFNEIDFNIELNERINSKIQRGKFLKDKKIELTESEKQEVDLAVAKEIELCYNSGWYEARETYQQERKRRILGR